MVAALYPLPRFDRIPIQLSKVSDIAKEVGRPIRRVNISECPFHTRLRCPIDDLMHVGPKMHDGGLPIAIGEIRMVALVYPDSARIRRPPLPNGAIRILPNG